MIVRIWRTEIERARMSEYEQFAQERSLPMFHQQQGFLAVLFLGTQKDRAVLSLWKDLSCVEALAQSSTYQETAAQLNATGLLVGQTSVEVFEAQVTTAIPCSCNRSSATGWRRWRERTRS
jgi:heme-degrading monooxygenase HmoA